MFRWLKDRSKKNRRLSASPTGSLLSKEDDYGFKQKLQPPPLPPQQQQQQLQSGEYKRDLPPTPADLMTSCNLTDDDKSLHIYEEIPDLPFRCTPEGELRIHLAKEAASRKDPQPSSAGAPQSWASPRNISPYMVVPLERLSETPSEFRTSPHNASRFHRTSSQQDKAFACALVGLKRSEEGGVATTSPCCDSSQQSGSSPSCCGSSVFGSPWLCGGGGGDGAVDMSERLLTAINLTRLLAAVRLSSSSADTCATSPLCIGVDKDGRNISVSVTPTTTSTSTNHHHHHHHHHHHSGHGEDLEVTSPPHPPESSGSKTNTDRGLEPPVLRSEPGSEAVQSDSSPLVAEAGGGVACPALGGGGGVGGATGLAPDTSPDCAVVAREKTDRVKQRTDRVKQKSNRVNQKTKCASQQKTDCVVHKDTNRVSQKTDCTTTAEATTTTTTTTATAIEAEETGDPREYPRPATTSLRFLPSPSEHSAITEILQLRPGEKTELDPATIDALLLRLCSHTLQADGAGRSEEGPPGGGGLHPQELEAVENMLKEMLKSGEEEAEREGQGPPSSALPSPGTRRAENSDTGFEYDVSTSSESDHANYDYFLSKAAQTRSLECEVKKPIHHGGEEGEGGEEEEGGEGASEAGESVTTVSTLSPTSLSSSILLSLTPEGDPDSDDGTMADLSESENSSGYYESVQHATGGAASEAADYLGGKKKEKGEEDKKKRTRERRKKKGEESPSEVDLPCYELHGTEEVSPYSALHSQPREPSSLSRLSAYSHLVSTAAAQRGTPAEVSASTTSGRTAHHKSKGGGKRPRHPHPHHPPHREGRQRRGGGGSAKHSPPQDGSPSRAHRDIKNPRDSDPSGGQDAGRENSTERVRKDGKKSSTITTSTSTTTTTSSKTRHPSDYPYYSLLYSQGTSSSRQRLKAPQTRLDLERSASFHSSHSQRDSSVYGQACRETSEVYSLPAALPDPRGGDRSLGGVPGAVGGGGSVGRQPVQEDSEVYGTRAGLQGGCHNRLLSDLIMLNYNKQVLNM
ncbi:hypothetical protein ACOMHN_029309 [Nucella lapillus]